MFISKSDIREFYKIPSIWMVFILLVGFVIGAGNIDALALKQGTASVGESGKLIRALSVILVGAFALIYMASRNAFRYIISGTNGWLFAFFFLCVASTVFSPLKTVTLFKSFEILVVILILSLVYTEKDRYEASKKYIAALSFFYILTVIGVYLQFLIYGTEGQRQLVHSTPLFGFMLISHYPAMVGNALGYLGAIVAMYGLYMATTRYDEKKSRLVPGTIVFFLGSGVTFFSYTRSIMFFLYMAVFVYFLYRKKYIVNVFLVLLVVLPLAVPSVQEKVINHLKRGDSDEAISTMSGRTEMWKAVFEQRFIKLMVGGGYATGSKFMNYEKTRSILQQSNVHNGFLEVVMSVGLVGGAIWLGIMFRLARQFYRFYRLAINKLSYRDRYFHLFMMALLFLSLARSIMNSTFVYLDYFYPLLMGFIMYGDSLRTKLRELSEEGLESSPVEPDRQEKTVISSGLVRKKTRPAVLNSK